MRMRPIPFIALLLVLPILSGCGPALIAQAAGTVASALVSGGGGGGQAADAGRAPARPTAEQSLPALAELANRVDAAGVTESCRSRLPEASPAPTERCERRPICMPGARQPVETVVCPSDHGSGADRRSGTLPDHVVWTWDSGS